ncbi:hypothetical protein RB195_006271 [Necator americanus]|uniref:Uncharacterized protein n=1 Tax=Necator americanus TaxID=51031 RepID=A0ABR1BVL6_NECAM
MQYCGLINLLLFLIIMPSSLSQSHYSLLPLGEGIPEDFTVSTPFPESPQGIFHHSENDNTFASKFKIPDFERLDPIRMASELMSAAAAAENRRKTLSGINLPLPFAGKPLRFEMTGESNSGLSLRDQKESNSETNNDLSSEAREAFVKAKRICLHSSEASCDEALDTYHRLKFGSSLMEPSSHYSINEDPTTSFAKMFVPALEEKLEELEKNVRTDVSSESIRSVNERDGDGNDQYDERNYLEEDPPHQIRHPFSNVPYPFTGHRTNARRMQDFVKRIS